VLRALLRSASTSSRSISSTILLRAKLR
jgi:hypothetical protein